MKHIVKRLLVTVPVLMLATAGLAQTDAYPSKPIHVAFPYPPGSPLDAVGRLIIERAGKILGQPMVFENRPGANGIIGTTYAARATPDGYVIHMTSTSAFSLNSFARKDLTYDPEKSFAPIIAVAEIPVALVVTSRIPGNSTRDFVQYVKANPGKVNYGSVGNASFNHLLMAQLNAAAGTDMLHVPYQGAAQVANELIAGRLDATVLSVSSVAGQWKAGQVKVLSIMSTRRSPTQPDVPAIAEEFPGFQPFTNWLGFLAPAGTPAPIIKKLNDAFNTVLQQVDIRQKIEEQQWSVIGGSADQFSKTIATDMKIIANAVKSAGIKPE